MSQPKDPAHVEISKIEITTFSGGNPRDIKHIVHSFDIFESLDNYTVTADFYLAEGVDLQQLLPMGGEEMINITLQTPGKAAITYKLFAHTIEGMKSNDQAMLKTYRISCCTKDFLLNASQKYTKRYTEMKYDAALQAVLTDMGAEESIQELEPTIGKFDYVVNNVRPFQTISLIKERAISPDNKSCSYVFYQDNKGYNFQTIEKIIKDRKGGAVEFKYNPGQRLNPYESVNYRNILHYETLGQGNSVRKVQAGGQKNQVREFDFHRGTYYKKEEYVNQSDQGSFAHTDDNNDFNSGDFNGFTQKLPGRTLMTIKDATRPDMKHNEKIHYQRAFREKLVQHQLRVRVYGDTNFRVGDVVRLVIPEITGVSRPVNQQEIFSEKYIITNLKHRCNASRAGGFEHFMIMDVSKTGNYGRPLG